MNLLKRLRLWWLGWGTHGFVPWLRSEYGDPCFVGGVWWWRVSRTSMFIGVSPDRTAQFRSHLSKDYYLIDITNPYSISEAVATIHVLAGVERDSL